VYRRCLSARQRRSRQLTVTIERMKKDSIGNPRAGQQPLTHPNELRRLFSKIDTDASGCLDKEELQVGRGAEQACLSLLAAFVQPGLARSPCFTSVLSHPVLRRPSCLVDCLLVHRCRVLGDLHSLLGRLARAYGQCLHAVSRPGDRAGNSQALAPDRALEGLCL